MTTDQQASDALRALVREPVELSGDGIQTVLTAIPHTSQQRSRLPHLDMGRFQSMFSATKFLVAGVIVALFGGLVLTGVFTQQPSEGRLEPAAASPATSESVQEVPPTATAVSTSAKKPSIAPPKRTGSGRLETPLGPARWVHLSGSRQSMPQFLEPIPVPGGYVALVETWIETRGGGGHLETTGLWSSPDLLRWTARSLPEGTNMGFASLADALWMLTIPEGEPSWAANTPDLWRSVDGSAWESIDASGLFPPAPDDIAWSMGFDEVVSKDGVEVMPLTFTARWAASHLLPGEAWGIEPLGDGMFQVKGGYGEDLDVVRFEPTEGGLRVVDASGSELATLNGWDMGFIERWASSWLYGEGRIPIEHRIGMVRDGALVAVELPGLGPGGTTSVAPTDEGITLFQSQEDGTTETWHLRDGLSWSPGDVIGHDPAEPRHISRVRARGTGLEAETHGPDGGPSQTWRSADGTTWQRFERAQNEAKPDWQARIGSGRLVIQKGTKLEFRPDDGSESTRIDTKRMGLKARPDRKAGKLRGGAISDHAVVISRRQGGVHDHWIIVFDDLRD